MRKFRRGTWSIILSFVIAIVLAIVILPSWLQIIRPLWVLLVLIYWVLYLDNRVNVGVAFSVGLLMDLLSGTLLGEHAVALVLVAYIVIKMQRQMRMFPIWQQAGMVMILQIIYLSIIFWVQSVAVHMPSSWTFWLPALTGAILWPWISAILKSWHSRFEAL